MSDELGMSGVFAWEEKDEMFPRWKKVTQKGKKDWLRKAVCYSDVYYFFIQGNKHLKRDVQREGSSFGVQ